MSKLSSAERNALPSSEFADPKDRKYPVDTPGRAQAAKGRAAEFAEPKLKAKVDAKADKKLGKKPKSKTVEYKRHWSQTKTEKKRGGTK